LTTGYEVWTGVDSGNLAALEITHEYLLAVLIQVGAGIQLDVVLLDLFIDGLFALPIRRGTRVGHCGGRED
jgi:hypothetical protein